MTTFVEAARGVQFDGDLDQEALLSDHPKNDLPTPSSCGG